MKGFENNKYAIKLEELLNQGNANEKTISKLRIKANKLRRKKSLELIKFINKPEKIESSKDFLVIQNLILSGADIEYTTLEGYTPFMISAINGQIKVAMFLEEKGVDVFKMTKEGQNALMLTLLVSHLVREGEIKSHKNVKFMPMVRYLQSCGLNKNMHCDFLGLTLNDYYLGNFKPFKKHLLTQIHNILLNFYSNELVL